MANTGPLNAPTLVTNWSQFTSAFGEFRDDSYLAHAVYGYFNNGGGAAYVVRVGQDGAPTPSAAAELPSAAKPNMSAYYGKCDAETNPPELIDAGQVTVEIGIAPVKPAEFVVFRLAQFSGGAELPIEVAASLPERPHEAFRPTLGRPPLPSS